MDRGSPFAWIVVARPDVAFADEIPADRACVPRAEGGCTSRGSTARGGANDRFAMAPPEGAAEYLGLYDSLCDNHALAAAEDYAGMIPRGVDSSEKVLRWHLRRRHVATDPWLLFNFVFYRVRSEAEFRRQRSIARLEARRVAVQPQPRAVVRRERRAAVPGDIRAVHAGAQKERG